MICFELIIYFYQIGPFYEGFVEFGSHTSLKIIITFSACKWIFSWKISHGFLKNSPIKVKFGKKLFHYIIIKPVPLLSYRYLQTELVKIDLKSP